MLEALKPQPLDKIIAMIGAFKADTRTEKLDLGVGVYKDITGNTPVMRAVKSAEARLLAAQESKSYVGLLGDLTYNAAMADLILGDSVDAARVASDIVLLGSDLAPIAEALETAKSATKHIRENFRIATFYNVIAVPFAIAGLATPLIAALAMSTSSIVVSLNALRLR